MNADPTIRQHLDKLVGTNRGKTRVEAENLLLDFLASLLDVDEEQGNGERDFERSYAKFESFFYKSTIRMRGIVPLVGLRSEIEKIQLDEVWALELLADDEAEDFVHHLATLGMGGLSWGKTFRDSRGALVMSFEAPKIIGEGGFDASQDELPSLLRTREIALQALRVLQPGEICAPLVQLGPAGWCPVGGTTTVFSGSVPAHFGVGAPCILSPEAEGDVKLLWLSIREVHERQERSLMIALRRFAVAAEEDNLEDRLIDAVIAAEAVYLGDLGADRGEMGYRLAQRLACFLGSTYEERVGLQRLAKQIYRERSKIVHGAGVGEPIKTERGTLAYPEFVDTAMSLVRKTLYKAVRLFAQQRIRFSSEYWERVVLGGTSAT